MFTLSLTVLQNVWRKLIEPQEEIDKPTIIVKDSNTLLTIIDRTSRTSSHIISNAIEDLNISTNSKLTKIYHTFAHNPITDTFKRIQIRQSIFSDDNAIKLKNNNRKISKNSQYIWKIKNTLLNNPRVKEEMKREIRVYFDLNKENTCQNLWSAMEEMPRGKLTALNPSYKEKI